MPEPQFRGPLHGIWGSAAGADRLRDLLAEPRAGLPTRPAADRAFWAARHAETVGELGKTAEAEFGTPWPQPLASHYARYFRDGNRTEYEGRIARRGQRLSRAAILAASTLDTGWTDEVVDGVVLLCEQSSWCWAAHDDVRDRDGFVVPEVHRPYLDLGAGEVAGQLAWLDVILGDVVDLRAPGVRERVRHEVLTRVIRPFLDRRDWHWLGLDGRAHNWNPWIHGNVVLAALFLVEDVRLRAEVAALAIEGLDRYAATLPADGAIDEGFSYWWNGACRLLETLELLRAVTGGALDASALPVLRETIRFPYRMHLSGDWYVNVADGSARAGHGKPWHVPHRWGRLAGDAEVIAHAAANRAPAQVAGGIGRFLVAVSDPEWLSVRSATEHAPLPERVWLPSVQVSVGRPEAGSAAGLTLMVKGGHNGEHHNHLDVGSFTVAVDGTPCLVDAGQPTYTAQTFSPDRYDIRAMRSGWHSVPAPWGLEQGVGAAFRAEEAELPVGGKGLSLDLTRAYPLPEGSSLRRVAALAADGTVTVTDSWVLPRPAAPATNAMELNYLVSGECALSNGTLLVRPGGNARAARLSWDPAVEAGLETWPLDDPLLRESWGGELTRLTLRVPAGQADACPSGQVTMTVAVEERP